ncbi:aconitate hydratase [Salvia divinorum]|uniref:Aconitate hydratase n=1 Tax=Salvia divinorum TaxID=28513 RepID=A0ABD1GC67_SALDI
MTHDVCGSGAFGIFKRVWKKCKGLESRKIYNVADFKVNPDYKGVCLMHVLCLVLESFCLSPLTLRFVLDGEMPDYVLAKDLILQMENRMTLCNMVIEAGGRTASSLLAVDATPSRQGIGAL